MSSFPETVAELIASALIDVASRSGGHRRLFLQEHVGAAPAAILESILARADASIAVDAAGETVHLKAVGAGSALLIPYLVAGAGGAGINRGSSGFAARLRSDFVAHIPEGQMGVLLVLGEDPVETVRTAAEDATLLQELDWPDLCARAISGTGSAQPPAAVGALARDLAKETDPSGQSLAALVQLASVGADAEEFGNRLHEDGIHLRDPRVAERPAARLARARKWRRDLERWAEPGQDLASRLRARGVAVEVIETVTGALRPGGLDLGAFTLDQLEQQDAVTLAFARPLRAHGARSQLNGDEVVIAWRDPGGTLELRLESEALAGDAIEISWSDASGVRQRLERGATHAPLPAGPAGVDWCIGTARLRRDGHIADQIAVACYSGSGTWFPVEEARDVHPEAGAFSVVDEPAVLAVGAAGRVIGHAALEVEELIPGERTDLAVELHGERRVIPIVLLGGGGGTGGDAGEELEVDGNGEPQGSAVRRRASPVHALLAWHAAPGSDPVGGVHFASDGQRGIISGAALEELAPQRVAKFEGLALERAILAAPAMLAYLASAQGQEVHLRPDSSLERLQLDSLDARRLSAFIESRQALFAALSGAGSAYALGAGVAVHEAERYVRAYADLIGTIPAGSRYQAEYDRLLLCDLVTDAISGATFLAPTNPVTVAFYLAFADAARGWIAGGAAADVLRELDSISPTHLLSVVMINGEWFESAPGPGLLWRPLRPLTATGGAPAADGRILANRLAFFLRVHPAYADPAQTIAVSVHEPGDGEAVAAGLRRFYRSETSAEQYSLPRIDLRLATADRSMPAGLEPLFAGGESATALDRLVRSRVRVAVGEPGDTFRHVSFTFASPAIRQPRQMAMAERASTLYAGGIAPAQGRVALRGQNEMLFARGTFAAAAAGSLPGLAGRLLPGTVRKTLELAGAQPRDLVQDGVTRMASVAVGRRFMEEMYRASPWVVHLDRQLGLEAFEPQSDDRARYIVDYSEPGDPGSPGLEGLTATEHVDPYAEAIGYALREVGPLTEAGLSRILDLLNAVSGRWALEVLRSNAEAVRERIGTIVAVAALQDLDRAFDGSGGAGVIIALPDLFEVLPDRPAAGGSSWCDDLLYLWVPHSARNSTTRTPLRISGRLIEVKYRSGGRSPDLGSARQEIENTRAWLDLTLNPAGPLRPFRGRDLAEMIRSGASRGFAFGLASRGQERALEESLARVADGDYDLDLSYRSGERSISGDVISVEMESGAPPWRGSLPGAGLPAALTRLGRTAIASLAAGRPLRVDGAWDVPQPGGSPPGPDPGTAARDPDARERGPAQPATAGRGRASPAPSAGGRGSAPRGEVSIMASRLDAAAVKYGLDLEPFSPDLAELGPSVIRYRTKPLGRQSLEGVVRRADDLGREIGASGGLLVAQEPFYITVDVPRAERAIVAFGDHAHLLREGERLPGALPFLLGMAPSGQVVVEDLARLPHLLLAGATGSGKSVLLRCVLLSLLERPPGELQILLVDPKQVDFLPFEEVPHLAGGRIVGDPAHAVRILEETIATELDRRRPILKQAGVTSALEFYESGGSLLELPQMVVVVDEFADLAATLGRQDRAAFMSIIQRYGQLTRAFGIYLVLATQRPSVQVITGDIKANLTARVAMKVQSFQDSMTILGRRGAETLSDKGDLLFDHGGRSERLQGFMAYPADVAAAVRRWTAEG